MNPLLLLGGAALVLFFLSSKRRHPLVRKGSPYDTAGSSFVPPDQQEGPPPPPSGTGFASRDDGPSLANMGDDLRSSPPRSRFGMSAVDAGSSLSRAASLREQLKVKPSDGIEAFNDIRAVAGAANPNDTDKWLALYDSGAPEIKLAMRSYNLAAAQGPFQILRVVVPGWTQDLSYGGGLTAKEQQDLIAIASAALASGQSASTNLSMAQMLPVLQSAFARAQFDPRSNIDQSPAVIEPLIAAHLSEANNAPAGAPDYPKFPPGPAQREAEQIAQNAFEQISALSQNLLPDFGQLLGSEKAALLLLGYRLAILNEGQEQMAEYIQRLGDKYARIALQSIYDEYGDIGPEQATRLLQEKTGVSLDDFTGLFS